MLAAVAAGLGVLLAGLWHIGAAVSAYADCVYVNSRLTDRNIVLFGRVAGVSEKDGWIIFKLKLCGGGWAEPAVEVFTPAGAGLVDIGEEGLYRGWPVFHWKKQAMAVWREFVTPGRFLALRPEDIGPEFPADCRSAPICAQQLEFWNRAGPESAAFLDRLRRQDLAGLAADFGLGRAAVFSTEFDRVETEADFRRLSERLTL